MKADGKRLAAGLFATIMGTGILLVGLQVIPVDPASVHAPFWVIGVCGLALIGCGCALLFESHRAVTNLAGLIVVASLMTVAFWVAFNAPPEEIQGGIPFLSAESNGRIGKAFFGFGGFLCLVLLVHGLRRLGREPD
ncbi:MAG: hypothetical protein JSW21_02765 [Gammaproteobacteria bacterium]|nr:MAG: hypothetical protein JSW21_02765 [Gammaproteobacteria bacterium]